MKIYQLHEFGGVWEDSYDYIIGSYLRKERAEEEKIRAEAEEEKLIEDSIRCGKCPFLGFHGRDSFKKLDKLLSKYPDYCTEAKLVMGDYGIHCENYFSHGDESQFEIKEVEVEE